MISNYEGVTYNLTTYKNGISAAAVHQSCNTFREYSTNTLFYREVYYVGRLRGAQRKKTQSHCFKTSVQFRSKKKGKLMRNNSVILCSPNLLLLRSRNSRHQRGLEDKSLLPVYIEFLDLFRSSMAFQFESSKVVKKTKLRLQDWYHLLAPLMNLCFSAVITCWKSWVSFSIRNFPGHFSSFSQVLTIDSILTIGL